MSVAELEAVEIAVEAPTGLWSDAWFRLRRNPGAIAGFLLVLLFIVCAVFAPWIAPHKPLDQDLSLLGANGIPPGPSWHHLFGVDTLGRDEFSRIIYGARLSLVVGVVSVAVGLSVGVRGRTILVSHILPNAISPVIVQGTLALATAIIEVAALSFLGLGDQNPARPEWGAMLTETNAYLQSAPFLAIIPGCAIVVSALGFNLIGDALREALDPKLRGRT